MCHIFITSEALVELEGQTGLGACG